MIGGEKEMKGLKYSASRPLLAFLAILFLIPLLAQASWYNSSWSYRKAITIDNTKVEANLSDFPVLISMTDLDLRDNAQSDGDDILFTSSNGTTKLSHEIESFNGSTGQLIAWVKITSLSSSSDTIIYMYYGNSGASSQQDATNVWDSNFAAVWHLKEDPSDTSPEFKDSTNNSYDATNAGGLISSDQISGKIGGALEFDHVSDDYVTVPQSLNITTNAVTAEAWVYSANWSTGADSVAINTGGSVNLERFFLGVTSGGILNGRITTSSQTRFDQGAVAINQWVYIVLRYDGSTMRGYIDGAQAVSVSKSGNIAATSTIGRIGARFDSRIFYGRIDEIRVSNTARSPEWIATSYNNQNDPSTFFRVGFTEATSAAGLSSISQYYGVAWGDYNNDGYPDLYISGANTLKSNNGDGTFSAGPALTGGGRATHWGDYDNDGYLDFAATLGVYLSKSNGGSSFTLQNNANIGITYVSNLGDVAWFDYDSDGDLDIWAANGASGGNRIYSNDGDGTFTTITPSGSLTSGNGEVVGAADYDGDGDTDIIFRIGSTCRIFRNDGSGNFTEVASLSITDSSGGYSGAAFGDYDNDGDLDLYLGGSGAVNKLYRNDGSDTFTDVTSSAGVAGAALITTGVTWGDYDNDGDLDLYVAHSNGANQLFRNDGDSTFTDVASSYGMNDSGASYGVMWADYDLDGDLDLFVGNGTNASKLFRNDLNASNYLKVKVTGKGNGNSPKDGTGARVELWDSSGTTRLAIREVFGGEGYGSHSSRIQHFGVAQSWGGGGGTYTVKVIFTGGATVTQSNVVPTSESISIGGTTLNNTIEVNEENMDHLVITGSTSQTAGSSQNITITAISNLGTTYTDYSGDKALTFSGANDGSNGTSPTVADKNGDPVDFGTATTITFSSGTATRAMILYKVESAEIEATDGTYGTSGNANYDLNVTVSPSSNSASYYLKVTGDASMTAGTNNELTITAYDQYGNIATGYAGSKSLTFSGLNNAPVGTVPTVEGTNIGSATSVNFTSGVSDSGAATLTAYKVETTTVDTTDGTVHSFTQTSYDLDLTVTAATAANLAHVSGNNQAGIVESTLANFFVTKVTDTYGNAVSGKTVTWAITTTPAGASGQSLSSASTESDANGEAQSQLTLGTKAGIYKVQASASSVTGSPVTYTATGNPNAAQDITLVSGSCQSGSVSTVLANPFVVKVTDSQGNAVSDISIGWSITEVPYGSSGYVLSSSTTVTDSDGEAESTLTIGNKAGLYKVEASCSGLSGSPVGFTATTGATVFIKGGSYYKISLPYQFGNGNAESVLSQLGAYNPSNWRLFRYANGAYVEYPSSPDFSPGLAYWLISVNDEALVISGTVVSANVTVTLTPGWNQIGCPFTCPVTWDAIKAANAALFSSNTVTDVLWGYDTEYLEFISATTLGPWQGFWVYNASGSNVDLIIPYL